MKNYYNFRWKNTLNYLEKLEKSQYLPYEKIEELQNKKLKNLVEYAYKNVPFYKKTFNKLKLKPVDIQSKDDLEKLPVITKEIIEDNLSEMISVKYAKSDLVPGSTGGSTGKNLKFYTDKIRYFKMLAVALRGDKWAGLDLGIKHAYLWGSQFDISIYNNYLNKILSWFQGSLFLSSYELSDTKMVYITNKLIRHNPKVLIAYPSPLDVYAEFLSKNSYDIHLSSIITSAETLYDHQRNHIEKVFQCKIFNRYGCREFGPIASECVYHQGLHINSEHLIVEFLALTDNCNSDYEERSNLIITDLDNYAMPFIRYEIGDIGYQLEKCECDRNLPLMDVEGRKFDIIVGTNGNRLGGTFWTLLFRTSIEGVKEFQVIQNKNDELLINLVVKSNFEIKGLNNLKYKIREYCGLDMKINFRIVDEIPLLKSGKFRFIINRCQDGEV